METVGEFLRSARQGQTMTMGRLSARAEVSKATLSRWESGASLPRIPELRRVLDALGVGGREQERALRLVDAPRAIIAAREGAHDTHHLSLGDMLRGLRLRSGKSQETLARTVGVTRSLLKQWENDGSEPTNAHLHALAFALGATADEVATLCTRRFAERPLEQSRDAVLFAYQRLYDIGREATEAEDTLQLLALLAHTGRLWQGGKASQGDIALMVTNFGNAAFASGDTKAQGVFHRRALALAEASHEPVHFHLAGAFRSVLNERINPRPRHERIAQAKCWFPHFRTNAGRAYLLMFIAQEVAAENPDEALRMADEYCTLVVDDESEYLCRVQDRGKLLLLCGRHAEAVAYIAKTPAQDPLREALKQLHLAKGLFALGSVAQSRTCLAAAKTYFALTPCEYVDSIVAPLERDMAS